MLIQTGCGRSLLRVAVLMGGMSQEREVSLGSGQAVEAALLACGHSVLTIDPSAPGFSTRDWSAIDVAFIALHGSFGEDGQIQQILESAAVPYTGSGPEASRLAFSKSAAKERFRRASVPTPEYALIHRSDSAVRLRSIAAQIGFPLVIKPDQQGSSLGVSIVQSAADLDQAVRTCFQFGTFAIMEHAVTGGGEWTLGVIDSQPLPLLKIVPRGDFFDYSAKYDDDQTGYTFRFKETVQTTEQIVRAGLLACCALDTEGIARVDLRVDSDGRPWVLEVNTVPGMTDHSLVPKAALEAGISMPRLCDSEIRAALRRHHRRHAPSDRSDRSPRRVQLRAG